MKAKHVLDIEADGRRALIMCKSVEQKRDFKIVGSVRFYSYEIINEELNNEGENIHSLNDKFLTYYIVYCKTNEYTKTMKGRAVIIEQDYKFAKRWVKVIVEEAKTTKMEASSKKIQI